MVEKLFQGRGYTGAKEKNRGRRQIEINEKNYFFVDSGDLPGIYLKEPAAGGTYFGKLQLTVTAQQDIYIGSGEVEEYNNRLYDSFSYSKKAGSEAGEPVPEKGFTLPGSSMKGSVLTNLFLFLTEASTGFYSPPLRSDEPAKVFFSDFPITAGYESKAKTIPGRFNPRIPPPDTATLKMYRKDDLAYANLSKEDWKALQSKENILTIAKGCTFEGFINFKLLSLEQLLFLVLALGCFEENRYCFKVGGAKNRGMGLVGLDMDMTRSFYAKGLRELGLGKERSIKELEPQLITLLTRLKQRYAKIDTAVTLMQKEYGVPE